MFRNRSNLNSSTVDNENQPKTIKNEDNKQNISVEVNNNNKSRTIY